MRQCYGKRYFMFRETKEQTFPRLQARRERQIYFLILVSVDISICSPVLTFKCLTYLKLINDTRNKIFGNLI